MAGSILQTVDDQLDQLFAGWNVYSTILAVVILAYLISPLFLGTEADTHPFLLSRQAAPSAVRQPGESAVYRSVEVPHGYPLRTGLNVKDEGAPKWAAGRDGDLRDVWREASKSGGSPADGKKAQIVSVKGKDAPLYHDPEDLSKEINIIGQHLKTKGGSRIAIYLPNSVELLIALLATAFYGLTPILIPQGQSVEELGQLLKETQASTLIAPAGVLSSQDVISSSGHVKQILWVVEQTSRHMNWLEEPETGSNFSEWHGLVDQHKSSASSILPAETDSSTCPNLISVWQKKDKKSYEVVEFTQNNIVAAISGQINSLPRNHRLDEQDLVLSLESLTLMFPLTITLAALYSHASVAFNSSAGPTADFDLAFLGVKPTIVIASAETIARAHAHKFAANQGFFQKIHHSRQASSLAAGAMRKANTLVNRNGPRIIYTSERLGADSVPLSPLELNDLRILTGARVIYALTLPKVAGAVAQTNMLDYRIDKEAKKRSHFGPPLSSVEMMAVNGPAKTIPDHDDAEPAGYLVVSGPAVVGGENRTNALVRFGDDHTLALE